MVNRSKSNGKTCNEPRVEPHFEPCVKSWGAPAKAASLADSASPTAPFVAVWGGHAAAQEPPETVVNSLVESLVVLGENYEAGEWVRQSNLLAYMQYLLAATAGQETAETARHRIARRLSPAEIAAAQALARQCCTTDYWRFGETTMAEDLTNIADSDTVLRYSRQQSRQ